ncbi:MULTISPECIES: PssE/Cps14G family polysaccharide biosynthesis glycosyltransferase [unclassified Lacrimispora]|uniref:PssE/Cps14G family polysaccharide biosynthesis glycosyltransferase n=1 Tax=unclassified Lacrimispora TaxID=2719232 RepID=UPI00376F85EC
MIFITVGSRSFQFNRLLEAIDIAVIKGEITDEIFAQIGPSEYKPTNYQYVDFLNQDEFNKKIEECGIVITHGGTGIIVNSVKMGKKVIAVPRLAKYHEVVDDHQLQLVREFEKMGLIVACYETDKIASAVEQSKCQPLVNYHSNSEQIIESIRKFINSMHKCSMKVLVVSNMYPSKKYPSAGIFVKRFCDELDKINVSFELSVMRWNKGKIKKLLGYIVFFGSTFKKIIFNNYDIVYIHYASHSSIPVLAASKFKHFSIITNVHGSDVVPENRKQEKFQKYTRRIIGLSQKVVVPSDYFKNYVSAKYCYEPENIVVYPSCGVDRKLFFEFSDNRVSSAKKDFNLNSKKIVISYIGRITTGKGWDTYLRAIGVLIEKGYDAEFVFAGDGNEVQLCNELISELGIESKIKKFPLLDQQSLLKMYNCSDVFVFPTEREGESLGLVAIEAMSCGVPVIASDFAAPKYYVEDGYNGYKFKKGNSEELANILAEFICGKFNKNQFKEGVNKTAKKYSNEIIATVLEQLFREIDHE